MLQHNVTVEGEYFFCLICLIYVVEKKITSVITHSIHCSDVSFSMKKNIKKLFWIVWYYMMQQLNCIIMIIIYYSCWYFHHWKFWCHI